MPRDILKRLSVWGLVGLALWGSSPAQALDWRFGKWTNKYSPVFPVVRVYGCPNQFNTHFSSTPWYNISRQLSAAMNEWFVGGGSHLRLRYAGDLPASSPKCADPSIAEAPDVGTIVVTAARSHPANYAGYGEAAHDTDGTISWGRVILYAGQTINGSFVALPWATNANYPASGQIDFWMMFAHELGHAIGFYHRNEQDSLMEEFILNSRGNNSRRTLAVVNRRDLLDYPVHGYGPIKTQTLHRYSPDNGTNWYNEGEALATSIVGTPAVARMNGSYLVASTASEGPSGTPDHLLTYQYSSNTSLTDYLVHPEMSFLPPAIAFGGGRVGGGTRVLAYVEAGEFNRQLFVKTANDNLNWSAPRGLTYTTPPSTYENMLETGSPPALAHANWNGWFLLAYASLPSGEIKLRVSKDSGLTFPQSSELVLTGKRTFHGMGLACQDASASCTLLWSDANNYDTPLSMATLKFDAAGSLFLDSTSTPGYYSYGAGAAANSSRVEFAFRDRQGGTFLTSGGWVPPYLQGVTGTSVKLHAAPSVAWNPDWSEWTAWSAFASDYDQL